MLQNTVKRILMGIPIVLGVVTLVFFLVRLAPGDPITVIAGEQASPELIAQLEAKYGLDQPLFVQWVKYVGSVLHGDFGRSVSMDREVLEDILFNLKYTMHLLLGSMVIAISVGIPLGIITAVKRNSWVDHICRIVSLFGVSMPNFWFGLILLRLFSVQLGLFPVTGVGEEGGILGILWHLVLPSVTLGLPFAAMITRMTRTTMIEVMGEQYMLTAKAKGLTFIKQLMAHGFRNASIPVITVIGVQVGRLLSMGLVVETVFARPGIGTYLYLGITNQDYMIVQGCIIFCSVLVVGINILLDILYAFMDPRIQY